MTMMPWPDFTNRQQLEAFLREQMESLQEQNKLDFKADIALEKSGGGKDPKGRTNLVRLISAFANTEDRLFDDYGFLVLGFSTDTGQICHVPMLERGGDKLEPQIAHLLEHYLQPVPNFDLHIFDEPGVGKWGCFVIPPGQAVDGPFIFIRESSEEEAHKWRVGEWRVRRQKKVEPPLLEDYRRIELGKVARALAPLRQDIASAHQRIAQLEGEVRLLSHRRVPALRVEIVAPEKPVQVLLTPAKKWPQIVIENLRRDGLLISQVEQVVGALEAANASREQPVVHKATFGEDGEKTGRSIPRLHRDLLTPTALRAFQKPLVISDDVRSYLRKMVKLLIDRDVPDRIFELRDAFYEVDLIALSSPFMGGSSEQKRTGSEVALFEQTLALYWVLQRRFDTRLDHMAREQQQDRCFSYTLRIFNDGPVKSGKLHIELSTQEGSEVRLIDHVPATPAEVDEYQREKKQRSGLYSIPSLPRPFEREPVEAFEVIETESLTASSMAPGQQVSGWELAGYVTTQHSLESGKPASFRLQARITSDELPEPQIFELEAEIPVEYVELRGSRRR